MNDETNQTFVYDGYTAAATYGTEPIRTNVTYDQAVDEPIMFEMPKDAPGTRR